MKRRASQKNGSIAGLTALAVAVMLAGSGEAGIKTDGSVGPVVERAGQITISSDLGSMRGGNLFHSFERFSIETGESATFTGPSSVTAIISRVTGGQRSGIDGALRSEIAGASFFLINPSGVVFGPSASISIQGAFHVSTANRLRFNDGTVWQITDPVASTLTAAPPESFGFLDPLPGSVEFQGARLSHQDYDLSFTAPEILVANDPVSGIRAGLDIANGRVRLAAASVDTEFPVQDWSGTAIPQSGSLILSAADIMLSGSRFYVLAREMVQTDAVVRLSGGGHADIRADAVSLQTGSRLRSLSDNAIPGAPLIVTTRTLDLADGSVVFSGATGSGDGGRIAIVADNLRLTSDPEADLRTSIVTTTSGTGAGGPIRIAAENIQLSTAEIVSTTSGNAGPAGDIQINANRLTVRDGGQVFSGTIGNSDAGRIDLAVADAVDLSAGGFIVTAASGQATGNASDIAIAAPTGDVMIGNGVAGESTAPAGILSTTASLSSGVGVIALDAHTVTLTPGGAITVFSSGVLSEDSGAIAVTAAESIRLTGSNQSGNPAITALTLSALSPSGSIDLEAPVIAIEQASVVSASAFTDGGDITLDAGRIDMTGSAPVSSLVFGSGEAGQITVSAHDSIRLAGSPETGRPALSSIAARPSDRELIINTFGAVVTPLFDFIAGQPPGASGGIMINAPLLTLDFAGLSTETFGAGGNIVIDTSGGSVALSNVSGVNSSSFGAGQGGDVMISSGSLSLSGNSSLSVSSFSLNDGLAATGDAGSIGIDARSVRLVDSEIGAISENGSGGQITLAVSGPIDLNRSLIRTAVGDGSGNAGDIRIQGGTFLSIGAVTQDDTVVSGVVEDLAFLPIPFDGAEVSASADQGDGGAIFVTADVIALEQGAAFDATSRRGGVNGEIDIVAAELETVESLTIPPPAFYTAARILRAQCPATYFDNPSFLLVSNEPLPERLNLAATHPGGRLSYCGAANRWE